MRIKIIRRKLPVLLRDSDYPALCNAGDERLFSNGALKDLGRAATHIGSTEPERTQALMPRAPCRAHRGAQKTA